jgi:hypothetical protein
MDAQSKAEVMIEDGERNFIWFVVAGESGAASNVSTFRTLTNFSGTNLKWQYEHAYLIYEFAPVIQ